MEPFSLQADLIVIFRVMVAFFLGGLIGWERERDGISAGIRTYGAISLGACVFGVVSISIIGADPSRIAAQVATGIGFLCGGVIFRQGDYVVGLTTAATLWATSAVGLAISFGMYIIGIMTATLIFILLYLPRLPWWIKLSRKMKLRVSNKKD
ncbi:MAG: MgtC/SapB family protein [Gammaproteobacteria bacterium]|nr:MgtC/SapB family protein [Gammaproteobacteria bacterium]